MCNASRGAALFAGAVALSIASAFPAVSADYRGTQDQQQACTPDVMRLCADSVPTSTASSPACAATAPT